MNLNKHLIALTMIVLLAACEKPVTAVPDDMSEGNPRAAVTVTEYASVACPVCGQWYRQVFPAFKAKYIDTGKIKYVTREMLVGDAAEQSMAAAGFLLARCAGKDKYFAVTGAIFNNQQSIYGDPRQGLLDIAKSIGMDEAKFDACVKDQNALAALDARVKSYGQNDNIHATPTFVINGKAMAPGFHSLDEIDAAIAAAQPK